MCVPLHRYRRRRLLLFTLTLFWPLANLQPANGVELKNAKHITAIAGDNVVFDCPLDFPAGQPVPYVIEWKKQKMQSPLYIWYDGYQPHVADTYRDRVSRVDLRSRRYGLASLNMSRVSEQDSGWYECVVHFLNRSPAVLGNGTWVHLDVHAPPRLVSKSAKNVFVNIGDSVILNCEARGTPEPVVTWYKEDVPVQTSDRVSIKNEGSELRISRLAREDIGDYTCFAENREGNVHWTIKVIMAGGATIEAGPSDVTAIETNRAVLHCRASSQPDNYTISWLRDSVPLQQLSGGLGGRRQRVLDNGSLVIEPVSAEDAGTFTCHVTNGIGTAQRASAQLSVEYAAHVPYTPSVQYLPLGRSGVIRCHIKANPAVQFVNWYRNRRQYDPATLSGVTLLLNGSLLIENVSLDHQGTYVCRPFNLHGSKGDSADMQVVVRRPPHFVVTPPPLIQRSVYDSVQMVCQAEGAPQPQITWRRHDNKTMPADRITVQEGNVTISSLRKSDFGFYECLAQNSVSTIATTTQLVVEGTTPHAPYNITTNATSYAISVQWQPGYSGGADFEQHYVVWYQQTELGQWNTYEVTPPAATAVTIYHLLPNTSYQLMVAAKNSIGDGMFSDKIVVTTPVATTETPISLQNALEVDAVERYLPHDAHGRVYYPMVFIPQGPRPGAPRNVAIELEEDGYLLSWQPPAVLDGSSTTLYYSIKYKAADESWRRLGDEKLTTTKYLVKRLIHGKHYMFKVFAHSLTSYSSSDEVELQVPTVPQRKAITAALVGGLLLLIVSVILSVCTVKICNKHKRRKQEKEYNMVACRMNEARNCPHSPATVNKCRLLSALRSLFPVAGRRDCSLTPYDPKSATPRCRILQRPNRLSSSCCDHTCCHHPNAAAAAVTAAAEVHSHRGVDSVDCVSDCRDHHVGGSAAAPLHANHSCRLHTSCDTDTDPDSLGHSHSHQQKQQPRHQQQQQQKRAKSLGYRLHVEYTSQPVSCISRQADGRFVVAGAFGSQPCTQQRRHQKRPASGAMAADVIDNDSGGEGGDADGGFLDSALPTPAAVRSVACTPLQTVGSSWSQRRTQLEQGTDGGGGDADGSRRESDGFGRHQLPNKPWSRSVLTPDGFRFRASSPGPVAGHLGPFNLCELSTVPGQPALQQLSTATLTAAATAAVAAGGAVAVAAADGGGTTFPSTGVNVSGAPVIERCSTVNLSRSTPNQKQHHHHHQHHHQLYENWPPLGRWRGPLSSLGTSLSAPAAQTPPALTLETAPLLLSCLQLRSLDACHAVTSIGLSSPFYANLQRHCIMPYRHCQPFQQPGQRPYVSPLATSSPPPPPLEPFVQPSHTTLTIPLVYRAEPQAPPTGSNNHIQRSVTTDAIDLVENSNSINYHGVSNEQSTDATLCENSENGRGLHDVGRIYSDSGSGLATDEISPSSSLGRQPLTYTRDRLQLAIGRVRSSQLVAMSPLQKQQPGDTKCDFYSSHQTPPTHQPLATASPNLSLLFYQQHQYQQQQHQHQHQQQQVPLSEANNVNKVMANGNDSPAVVATVSAADHSSSSGITSKNSSGTNSDCRLLDQSPQSAVDTAAPLACYHYPSVIRPDIQHQQQQHLQQQQQQQQQQQRHYHQEQQQLEHLDISVDSHYEFDAELTPATADGSPLPPLLPAPLPAPLPLPQWHCNLTITTPHSPALTATAKTVTITTTQAAPLPPAAATVSAPVAAAAAPGKAPTITPITTSAATEEHLIQAERASQPGSVLVSATVATTTIAATTTGRTPSGTVAGATITDTSQTGLALLPTGGVAGGATDMEARVLAMRHEFQLYRQQRAGSSGQRVVMETVC